MKYIESDKEYKISGKMLVLVSELRSLYDIPLISIDVNGGYKQLPFPSERRDYLIGRLVQEFENMEWEEL